MNQTVDSYTTEQRFACSVGFLIGMASWLPLSVLAANSYGYSGKLPPPPPNVTVTMGQAARPIAGASAKAPKAKEEIVVLQSSKPIVVSTTQWQKWDDYLAIKPASAHVPLTLTFENGPGGTPRFVDLKIWLARRLLATMRNFNGLPTLNLNLTNAIGAGDTLLSIQGYGVDSAQLRWKLTTPKAVVTSVNPSTFGLADKVHVLGKNFVERAGVNQVTIGNKAVTVINAKKDQLDLKLPADLPGGKQDLVVTVGTIRCAPLKVTVKVAPEVTSINYVSTAPGQEVVVFGKGFSTTASENQISFGGVPASIVSVTADSITCIVPDMPFPQWGVPITVKTNSVESKGDVTVNLQLRVIPNEGIPEQ